MWLEVVSNLDIFLWQWKERINGSQLLPEHKGKRNEGKNVSVYETSHSSCSFLNGIDFYCSVYGFKSAVTFYTYIFSYENEWWISQNLISSWISLEKQACLLYNVIVMFISLQSLQRLLWWSHWPVFIHSKRWTMGKNDKNILLLVEILLRNQKLRDQTLYICKRIKLNPVLHCTSQCLVKKFVWINLLLWIHLSTHVDNLLLPLTWIIFW